jgi:hypothetical protein
VLTSGGNTRPGNWVKRAWMMVAGGNVTNELQVELVRLRQLYAVQDCDAHQEIMGVVPALLNAAETLIGMRLPEHSDSCPRRWNGYERLRCRCDKDEIDAALADLLRGLKGDR